MEDNRGHAADERDTLEMETMSVESRKLHELTPDHANANKGTERGRYALETSLRQYGAGRSILLDKNGRIIAGNKTAEVAADVGMEDVIVVQTDGKQIVAVQRTDLDIDSEAGRGLAYADNRVGELSLEWDAEQVLADLNAGVDLSALWREDELKELIAGLDGVPDYLGVAKDAKPNPRKFALDAIYTTTFPASCCLAVNSGFKIGIQSTKEPCPCVLCGKYPVTFVDNDYFNYNHEKHLDYVRRWRPKYATVRDVMTPEQCQESGIEHYSLEQVLAWAAELAQYAENVIVIPKYDCLAQIPDCYMLGYSVPTSHGGTPLPVEAFKGRRVHLLGGSWKAQLAHMAVLGDDVVSMDNNYQGNIAQMGGAVLPDGTRKDLPEYGIDTCINPAYVALAISLGNMGTMINELYPVAVNQEENG